MLTTLNAKAEWRPALLVLRVDFGSGLPYEPGDQLESIISDVCALEDLMWTAQIHPTS